VTQHRKSSGKKLVMPIEKVRKASRNHWRSKHRLEMKEILTSTELVIRCRAMVICSCGLPTNEPWPTTWDQPLRGRRRLGPSA
jgi:hypothetical protein